MNNRILYSLMLEGISFVISQPASLADDDLNQVKATALTVDVLKIYGKIQIVNSFPDYKVQVVNSFPDLKVQVVNSFPDKPGKLQMVNSFPDYKIHIVNSFPDFKIQYVNSFPGKP